MSLDQRWWMYDEIPPLRTCPKTRNPHWFSKPYSRISPNANTSLGDSGGVSQAQELTSWIIFASLVIQCYTISIHFLESHENPPHDTISPHLAMTALLLLVASIGFTVSSLALQPVLLSVVGALLVEGQINCFAILLRAADHYGSWWLVIMIDHLSEWITCHFNQ